MARIHAAAAFGAVALTAAVLLIPASAHEGHGKPTGSTFDPNAPKKVSAATAMAIGLQSAEVDFGQVEDVVRLTGMVQARPDSLIAISPKYAGVVRSILVQPGDVVTKGTVLAEVDSPEIARLMYDLKRLEAENEKLLSEVTRAESQVTSLEIEVPAFARSADLLEAEIERLVSAAESIPANLFAQRKADALRLRADAELRVVALKQAKADVESLRRQAQTTRASTDALRGTLPGVNSGGETLADPARPGVLRFASPIDGVVISRGVVPGGGVSAGAAIVTVGNFGSVQIEGEIPEGLLDRLASAHNAKVRIRRGLASSGEPIAGGVVRFISPVINMTTRTAHLIVDADNSAGSLRQGQFVELAVIIASNEAAVVVPASAIVKEGPLQYVFIKEGKGESETFEKRDVATGVRDDRQVEIKLGLVPGDVIAVSGAFSLSQLRGFVEGASAGNEAEKPKNDHGHTH